MADKLNAIRFLEIDLCDLPRPRQLIIASSEYEIPFGEKILFDLIVDNVWKHEGSEKPN